MKTKNKLGSIQELTITALLIAVGMIIPMFSPVKILLEPASFTLASHVAIFIAMFISVKIGIAVSIGTTLGFLFGGFPPAIVLRAATHIIFVTIGALWIKKQPSILASGSKIIAFSLIISVIHAFFEVIVVALFYFGNNLSSGYYDKGFVFSVLVLIGLGGIVHSMLDFGIAFVVMKAVNKEFKIGNFALVEKSKQQ